MYPRTLIAIALSVFSATLVASSPTPIDDLTAHNLAVKNNMGCSAPDGCTRNASAVYAASSSGATSSLSGLTAPVAVAALAGSVLAALV
ncbi:hypothetical protein NLI96_g5216 [Meripilus lineatus]|uniref:Uncharacterized protein n=1 Tax=Meripilus lineatus TaxID=2056292 RepID=A0AAD5V3E7_9APHY|nr:hypothetical protein NLI96_g5216 [Physisporinus lineatus]